MSHPKLRWFGQIALTVAFTFGGAIGAQAMTDDSAAPSVQLVTPIVATAGQAMTFSVDYSDPDPSSGMQNCYLKINGVAMSDNMTMHGVNQGSATYVYTFPSVGSFPILAVCSDNVGNTTQGPSNTVTVSSGFDTTAPTVGVVTPNSGLTDGTTYAFSATYNDVGTGLQTCSLIVDGVGVGVANLSGGVGSTSGVASVSTSLTAGSHSLSFVCKDVAGNPSEAINVTNVTVAAGASQDAPYVGAVWESTAISNQSTTFHASYNSAVTQCDFYVNDTYWGPMTLSAGQTATANYTYPSTNAASQNLYARCRNAAGTWATGPDKYVSFTTPQVQTDTQYPTVGLVWESSAVIGQPTTFHVTYGDNIGVTQCDFYINTSNKGSMTLSGQTGTINYTPVNPGTYDLHANCHDAAGNWTTGPTKYVTFSNAVSNGDTTPPVVQAIAQTTAYANVPMTVTATYSDNANAVTSCTLYFDGVNWGSMSVTGGVSGTASKQFAFNPAGNHTAYVTCQDAAGNVGTGQTRNVSTYATPVDSQQPSVSDIQPLAPQPPAFQRRSRRRLAIMWR